jgi:hypothetical protein
MANGIILAPHHAVGAAMQSNMPQEHKTQIRAWYDKLMEKSKPALAPVQTVAQETVNVAVADLVGALTGAALGYAESHFGTLDFGKRKDLPLDAGAAGLGAVASVLLAGHPTGAGAIARYASVAATAVYAQRKSKAHFDEHKQSAGVHGESSDSPLLEWAKNL